MQIIRTAAAMQAEALARRAAGQRIGLVPTMGYLHEGHLSLVHLVRPHADFVVVSIFVNPAQFGPGEDLAAYPRDFDRDERLCREAGADAVFYPEAADMYPAGYSTYVNEEALGDFLCGAARPGHFRGVCTVVAKLYNLCLPHVATFGEKDAQQLRILQRMTRDLNFPVRIIPGPIVREADGLAKSSRNKYLDPEQRSASTVLKRSLDAAAARFAAGVRDAEVLLRTVREPIAACPHARIDYIQLVDDATLRPVDRVDAPALIALAVFFGRARLLDNVRLKP